MYTVLVSLFFLASVVIHTQAGAGGDHAWNYDSQGPDAWPHHFANCKGKKQSPINILRDQLEFDKNLKPFKFYNYAYPQQWNVTHNGHTVVLSELNEKDVAIGGSDYEFDFDLLQFHFHWGNNDYQGSEHYIDGDKFPLEMHLVHKSKTGVLTVLGFLFKLSNSNNSALNPLLDGVRAAKNQHHWQNVSFSLTSILPELGQLDKYYRYSGSLTTPPCSEGVIWNVFVKTIEISHQQLDAFRQNDLKINFREPQRLYSRKVFASFQVPKVQNDHGSPAGVHQNNNKTSCQNQANILNQSLFVKVFFVILAVCVHF